MNSKLDYALGTPNHLGVLHTLEPQPEYVPFCSVVRTINRLGSVAWQNVLGSLLMRIWQLMQYLVQRYYSYLIAVLLHG